MSALQRLGLLAGSLRRLASVGRTAAPSIAADLNRLLDVQRAAGTDPYGKAHKPLKRPRQSGRTGPPLVDSGESYAGTRFFPRGSGVSGVLGGHLGRHMLAITNRVARAAFPRQGLPASWKRAASAAIQRQVKL